jgi:hypothetical protein
MSLVIKAGKGELSANDKEDLKKSKHPLLLQISDPNTSKLITIFSNLPTSSHKELLEKGYLKWKFANLDQQRQQIWRDIVQLNIDMAAKQGVAPNPSFSQAALQNANELVHSLARGATHMGDYCRGQGSRLATIF